MVDFDAAAKQHLFRDRRAAIDADPFRRRKFAVEAQTKPVVMRVGESQIFQFGSNPVVRILVFPVFLDDLVLALFVQLQLARQFDDDFPRRSVGFDQRIDDPAKLVEADMDGRVGHAPYELLAAFRRWPARDDVARQHLAVIGKRGPLFGAEVRMVQAETDRRLVIGERARIDLSGFRVGGLLRLRLHDFDQIAQHRAPELPMALGQARVGDPFGRILVQTEFPPQPGAELEFVLSRQQMLDDLDLALARQRPPGLAECPFGAKPGGGPVGFESLAAGPLVVEALVGRQLEPLSQRVEGDDVARPVHQRGGDGIALGDRQVTLRAPGPDDP